MRKKTILLAFLLLALVSFCGTLVYLHYFSDDNVIKIGVPTYSLEPYVFFKDGVLKGDEGEIIKNIFDNLGLEYKFIKITPKDYVSSLKNQTIDLYIGGVGDYYPKDEILHSQPYLKSQLVYASFDSDYTYIENIKDKRIGILEQSHGQLYFDQDPSLSNYFSEISLYSNLDDLIYSLEQRHVDVILCDQAFLKQSPNNFKSSEPLQEISIHCLSASKNQGLINEINGAIANN